MRAIFIAACLALAAGSATSDMVAKNATSELRLTSAPCTNPAVLVQLKPEFHEQFKRAHGTTQLGAIEGCWIDTGEGSYYVAFENGEAMLFPPSVFIVEPTA